MLRSDIEINDPAPPPYVSPPSYSPELYEVSLVDYEEQRRRHNQLRPYALSLELLRRKRDNLGRRYLESKNYNFLGAYNDMDALIKALNGFSTSYELCEMNLGDFKRLSAELIQNNIDGSLGKHRGYKEILVNLLLALGTLGVGYAIAALFTQSLTPIKCNTDSANILHGTKGELFKMK